MDDALAVVDRLVELGHPRGVGLVDRWKRVGLRQDGTAVRSPAFALAREHGLHRCAHAGESSGPEGVWDAIDVLGAERIDHGIRAVEDATLVTELAQRGVPLGICPTSNVKLGVAASLETHPRGATSAKRACASPSHTDDPVLFATDVLNEYAGHVPGLPLDTPRRCRGRTDIDRVVLRQSAATRRDAGCSRPIHQRDPGCRRMNHPRQSLVADGRIAEVAPEHDGMVLAHYLRDVLGLISINIGCEEGSCGACTALVNGQPVPTCLVHVARLGGATIETAAAIALSELGARIGNAIAAGSRHAVRLLYARHRLQRLPAVGRRHRTSRRERGSGRPVAWSPLPVHRLPRLLAGDRRIDHGGGGAPRRIGVRCLASSNSDAGSSGLKAGRRHAARRTTRPTLVPRPHLFGGLITGAQCPRPCALRSVPGSRPTRGGGRAWPRRRSRHPVDAPTRTPARRTCPCSPQKRDCR